MNLHATGCVWGIRRTNLIQAQDSAGGIVQLVMVDFQRGKRGVEGEFDIGGEGGILHFVWQDGMRVYGEEKEGKKGKKEEGSKQTGNLYISSYC